jgi:hypothetical protein
MRKVISHLSKPGQSSGAMLHEQVPLLHEINDPLGEIVRNVVDGIKCQFRLSRWLVGRVQPCKLRSSPGRAFL